VRLRVNSLAAPPRSDGLRGFEDLLDRLQVVDSLPLEEFSALPPSLCMNFTGVCSHREAKALSLLSFCNSDSFRAPSNTLPVLDSTFNNPQRAEVFQVLCTRSHSNPTFPFSDLLLRSSVRPALTCTARIIQINSGLNENESLTVEPPQRTLCGGIQLHSMQESPGSNRETIETHSLILSGFEPDMQSHMQHIEDKHKEKQVCNSIISTTHTIQTQPWN
jgi:hypothetical protein